MAFCLLIQMLLENRNLPTNVAVIGAGAAGLTAAYQLVKAGIAAHVFEASDAVGGLARTIDLWNQKVDLGPHRFFSSDRRVNQLWLDVIGHDYEMVSRLTRIYYKRRFFHYPLKPFNSLWNLGFVEAARCLASYITERLKPTTANNSFETWVVQRFGRRLFDIFFKTYSEKLWGVSCRDLDSDFAAQRIKKLSLYEAIKNAFLGGNKTKHKTLVDQFAYPHGGTGELYKRMANYIEANGGSIECKRPVRRVLLDNNRVAGLEFENGEQRAFDRVISTMPINLLVTRFDNVPAGIADAARSLQFRNTILVFLKVESTALFADNWLYVHSPELRMGRVTNFRNWVPQLFGEEKSSILALEYWCNDADSIWKETDDTLATLAHEELCKTGLIGDAKISDAHIHRIPRCYPVYNRGYKNNLRPVERFLDSIENLIAIGRDGAFKYNNQDHSILMGLLAAENIAADRAHNLWRINTDYEAYQEASVITKTGLLRTRPSALSPTVTAGTALQGA
jgi:protoporphyrinogen oxidase